MADILLSYNHGDRERARPIVEMLENEGWSVWWDREIEPGAKWRSELDKELARTRAVVVLWSEASKRSDWVRYEARIGAEKGALVSVVLDKGAIPSNLSDYHATDLSGWNGNPNLDEVQALMRRLGSLVPPSRIDTIRPGYKADFLGKKLQVPLPGVRGAAAVLRYNHFTVVMNPGRRLAHYVAYNISGKRLVNIPRRLDDDWAPDPLLPDSLQLSLALLRRSEYDRGHLMARSTVSWGEKRQASIAARQAFFFTNISPQHQKLNRQWWLALERWERSVAGAYKRAIGLSGPVFGEDDPPFRGEVHMEDGLVAYDTFHIPGAYWKVVVVADGGQLSLAAFLMNQFEMLATGVGPKAPLSNYRISLSKLERIANVRFADSLHQASRLGLALPKSR